MDDIKEELKKAIKIVSSLIANETLLPRGPLKDLKKAEYLLSFTLRRLG